MSIETADILEAIAALGRRVDANHSETTTSLAGLHADVGTLKSDVGTLKSDVAGLIVKVDGLENGLRALHAFTEFTIEASEARILAEMRTGFEKFDLRLKAHGKRLDILEQAAGA